MIDANKPVGVTPASGAATPASGAVPPAKLAPEAAPSAPPAGDSIAKVGPAPTASTSVALFGDPEPAQPATPDLKIPQPTGHEKKPWGLQSLNLRYGLIFNNQYAPSSLHVKDPANGTDMTISGVRAHQRLSAQYLYSMPNGFPQPDEPQSEIAISGKFNNNWGFEANLKHHKYVVASGDEGDQTVHMKGTLNGAPIDEDRSLKGYLPEYQVTNGLNQISVMATRSFDLPHPKKDGLTYNVKFGPSIMMPFVKSTVVNADGSTTHQEGPYQPGHGFGAQIEHSLRYDFRHRVSLELTEGASFMNVHNGSFPNGGTVNQNVFAHSLALTLGYTLGKNFKSSRLNDK